MTKNASIAVLVIAAGAAIWWFFDAKSSEKSASPPLTGWMQNFTPSGDAPPTPPLSVQAKEGRAVPLTELGGKITLVNFWATWCGPCIREMPSLLRLHKTRGGKDFHVIALSQDLQGWPKVASFLKRHDLDGLPIFVDDKTAVARALKVKGLPTSILLGRDGRELGRLAGHAEWDSAEALALIDHYVKEAKSR